MNIYVIHLLAEFISAWAKLLARKAMKPVLCVSYLGELNTHYAKK